MKPTQVYAAHRSTGWTRIEMLLALYDGALDGLSRLEEATRAGNVVAAAQSRLRTARILAGLRAGIDLTRGELPRKIDQLCEFAQHALFSDNPRRVSAAGRVLARLRDGFAAIQQEAIALESRGEIPPLAAEGCREVLA
jgi:flagellin-specific chaperone FliS